MPSSILRIYQWKNSFAIAFENIKKIHFDGKFNEHHINKLKGSALQYFSCIFFYFIFLYFYLFFLNRKMKKKHHLWYSEHIINKTLMSYTLNYLVYSVAQRKRFQELKEIRCVCNMDWKKTVNAKEVYYLKDIFSIRNSGNKHFFTM